MTNYWRDMIIFIYYYYALNKATYCIDRCIQSIDHAADDFC